MSPYKKLAYRIKAYRRLSQRHFNHKATVAMLRYIDKAAMKLKINLNLI
jgi:hypothetical protein